MSEEMNKVSILFQVSEVFDYFNDNPKVFCVANTNTLSHMIVAHKKDDHVELSLVEMGDDRSDNPIISNLKRIGCPVYKAEFLTKDVISVIEKLSE